MVKKREAVWFYHSKMIKKGLLSPNVNMGCHPQGQIPEHENTRTLHTQLLPVPSGCKFTEIQFLPDLVFFFKRNQKFCLLFIIAQFLNVGS